MRGLRERFTPCPVCEKRHIFRQPHDCESLLYYADTDEGEDMMAYLVAEMAMMTGETIYVRVGATPPATGTNEDTTEADRWLSEGPDMNEEGDK